MSTAFGDLTTAQVRTFQTIRRHCERHGYPPTVGELSECLGKTKATVHGHLDALIEQGYLRRKVGKARSLEILRSPQTTVIDVATIPLLGEVPAGTPVMAEEHCEGEIEVEASVVRSDTCFALRVRGDSMRDADILEGDVLVVRRQPLAAHGEIVVASVDGEVTVKQLWMRDSVLRLLPANDAYEPIDVTAVEEFKILGKVIATRRHVSSGEVN